MPEAELLKIRDQTGMVFQEGALFDSLTVCENVGFKLYEETDMPLDEVRAQVEEVLGFVGLASHIDQHAVGVVGRPAPPRGDRPRDGFKPQLLLYDEPTTGLDPITSLTVDAEIIKLRDLEGVTSVLVTHQLRDAFYIATHTARARRRRPDFSSAPAGEDRPGRLRDAARGQDRVRGLGRRAARVDRPVPARVPLLGVPACPAPVHWPGPS